MANWETVEVTTDLLICGGGMAAAGAAVEAAYWASKNGLKVTVVDKAAFTRSGAVAMGLSAINQYIGYSKGENTLEDYVRYVRQDLMGIARDDLVYNIARHVDSSVHLFEKWGLPIWTDENGKYVHEGRWQIMINGESYKVIVAEAAKNAMEKAGFEIFERVFIVGPDHGRRSRGWRRRLQHPRGQVLHLQGQGRLRQMGGAVHVFRPGPSVRAWAAPGIRPSTAAPRPTSPSRPAPK